MNLKDFDPSYIKVDASIAEKIDTMRKVRPYQFKKIYNGDEVFMKKDQEIKIAYLNINGVLDADHFIYLNSDKNLLNLDLIVLAETKLTKEISNEDLTEKLGEFHLLKRYDANDGMKHMGLLMMSPKKSSFNKFDSSMLRGFKDNSSQGFVYGIMSPLFLKIGFLYIRPGTGSKKQIDTILKNYECNDCDILMGDLNLNPRKEADMLRIKQLCH